MRELLPPFKFVAVRRSCIGGAVGLVGDGSGIGSPLFEMGIPYAMGIVGSVMVVVDMLLLCDFRVGRECLL
jgi:hypothetical protein